MLIAPVSFRPVAMQATNNIQRSYASNVAFGRKTIKSNKNNSLVQELLAADYKLYKSARIKTNNGNMNVYFYIQDIPEQPDEIDLVVINNEKELLYVNYNKLDGTIKPETPEDIHNTFHQEKPLELTRVACNCLHGYLKEKNTNSKR